MPVFRNHRLVVLGGDRVGKTAIIEQFIFGNHVIGQGGLPTLGDVYEATVETEKGPCEKLHIFDTPGSLFTDKEKEYEQEHYLSIADGYLLVYEITSRSSYDLVLSLRQKIATKNKDVPIVVLGNKSDLNAIREVDSAKASQQCKGHGVKFYEVTVQDRESLKEAICYLAWRMSNPGRPFPQIAALTSSTNRHSAAMATASHHTAAKIHRSNKSTPSLSMTSSRMALDEEEDGEPGEEVKGRPESEEGEEEEEEAFGGHVWKPMPDDAEFPRRGGGGGGGRLFFADCLSSKNKYNRDIN